MWHIKNINKGWITSLVGYLIIFACLASVFMKRATWTEAVLGMGVGVTLLGTPDPKLPSSGGGATGVVGVLVLSLAFGGCVSLKTLQDKYGTQSITAPLAISDWYHLVWTCYQAICTWVFSAYLLVLTIMLGAKLKLRLLMLILGSVVALGSAGSLAGCAVQKVPQGKFRPVPLPKKICRNLHRN